METFEEQQCISFSTSLNESIQLIDCSASEAPGCFQRLLSKLSASCQTNSIRAALLLWWRSVFIRSRSLDFCRQWLLLMFSCHRLAFHRTVSQRCCMRWIYRERDINKNAARTYLVCVTAQEMKSVWQKRNWGDEVNQINQRSKFNLCAKVLSTHQRT